MVLQIFEASERRPEVKAGKISDNDKKLDADGDSGVKVVRSTRGSQASPM